MTVSIEPATRFEDYAREVMELRYSHLVTGRKESWEEIAWRVVYAVMYKTGYCDRVLRDSVYEVIKERKFIPGGRILAQAGREYHQTDNCFTLRAEDSREGWAQLASDCTMMFMSGGGIGVDYSQIRPFGTVLKRSGGVGSGPCSLLTMIDGIAEGVRQGGERRGACYGSLLWSHQDIEHFIKLKQSGQALKHTNISVQFPTSELEHSYKYLDLDSVFDYTVYNAVKYGDPGFQFDCDGQTLRNACAEIISADDSDSCCLGSVNLARIESITELAEVTNLAVLFLLCNTLYTDKPTLKVEHVKSRNRRLGLGLMGVAEWFIQRGLPYGCMKELNTSQVNRWLHVWRDSSDTAAKKWSNKLNVNRPIAVRAIAPTGTISIAGGFTTPGIEPVFHTAYKRTYNTLKEREYKHGYEERVTIDPVVYKMYLEGYNVEEIDTAWQLSQSLEGIERRIAFQAYCQQFVDNAISSTVNLPPYVEGSEVAIGAILRKYAPYLRGITFYPDGQHQFQPVQPVPFDPDMFFQLKESESCKSGICGM